MIKEDTKINKNNSKISMRDSSLVSFWGKKASSKMWLRWEFVCETVTFTVRIGAEMQQNKSMCRVVAFGNELEDLCHY